MLEYVLLAAVIVVATVVFWKAAAREVPGALAGNLQEAILCMTNYIRDCGE